MSKKMPLWKDGHIVPYAEAQTHVLSHTLHYGLGVFEGIRAYRTHDGRTAVFRLADHIKRLFDSCHLATLEIPYTPAQLIEATLGLLQHNRVEEGYIRPVVWLGEGSVKIAAADNTVHVAIAAWPWGAYLGEEALEKGVRCCISSYTRIGIRSHLEKAKIAGQYVNSVLAKREALANGFDEAILLDEQGYATEGTGENLFVARDGVLLTPPRGASLLAGITRHSVLALAEDRGIPTDEAALTRSDLYTADEVFLTGTAAEISPVSEIDGRRIGAGRRGPVTERIQTAYFEAVRGKNATRSAWLAYVDHAA